MSDPRFPFRKPEYDPEKLKKIRVPEKPRAPKYFTWFDINRILRNMESPSLNNPRRIDNLREYDALIGAFNRIVAHIDRISAQELFLLFDPYPEAVGLVIQVLGDAVVVSSELLTTMIEEYG